LETQGVVLDLSNCTNINRLFSRSYIQKVPVMDLRKATVLTEVFMYCTSVESIDKIILKDNGSQNLSNFFYGTYGLKEVRFEGTIGTTIYFTYFSLLSDESVQSIIDHLKDLTGTTTQKLTFHAKVGAKMTDAQKAAITAKNWTLVY
jgi:hypothetical protein